jgi:hypothetical protein
MSIIVLCPTRGRPGRAAETLDSFRATAQRLDSRMVFLVDRNDPEFASYIELGRHWSRRFGVDVDAPFVVPLEDAETGDLVRATNARLDRFWDRCDVFGHVGDDHLFRTIGWDTMIDDVLEKHPGVAYGNDGFQGQNVPTAAFVSTKVVKALGWLALPGAHHLFIDNTWKVLGEQLESLHYLPYVSIEHMHPAAGKGPMDEGYAANNAPSMYEHDGQAFQAWLNGPMVDDIARVKAALL